ncbi:uncharacterized protein LOC105843992 isoform X1 [Hydra vulgaris]|uniref:uncharacterized protein LOC105843992 isoform X1 n=1 Tax=Hydra vulgaris TaxID=6087 RepID=UPI001F5E6C1F|nr:kinetochore protein spc25 [Hydra vulgaris]
MFEQVENEIKKLKYFLAEIKENREENYLQLEDRVKQYKNKIKKYQKETEELTSSNINDHPTIIELVKEVEELTIAAQNVAEENIKKKKYIHDKENYVQKVFQDIAVKEQVAENKSKKIMKGLRFFEENLGLRIIRYPDSHLKFTFTCIDEADIDREFSFHLTLVESKKDNTVLYEVFECNPQLPMLENIVKELNLSNNLRKFLCAVRREFQAAIV